MPHSTPHSDGSSSHRKSASSAALKSMLVSPRSPHVHLSQDGHRPLSLQEGFQGWLHSPPPDRPKHSSPKRSNLAKRISAYDPLSPSATRTQIFPTRSQQASRHKMLLLWSACLHRQNPIIHQKGMGEAIDQYQGHLPEKLDTGSTQLEAPRRLSNSSVPT